MTIIRKIFIPVFTVFLLLNSCKKDEINVLFRGQVVDYYTGKGISGATIFLKTDAIDPSNPNIQPMNFYDTSSYLCKTKADLNGNFDKTISIKKGKYKVIVLDSYSISPNYVNFITDSTKDILIKAKQFKPLKISLTNVNHDCDSLDLSFMSTIYSNTLKVVCGSNFSVKTTDTIVIYNKAISGEACQLSWMKYKNGSSLGTKNTSIPISISGNDSFNLEY